MQKETSGNILDIHQCTTFDLATRVALQYSLNTSFIGVSSTAVPQSVMIRFGKFYSGWLCRIPHSLTPPHCNNSCQSAWQKVSHFTLSEEHMQVHDLSGRRVISTEKNHVTEKRGIICDVDFVHTLHGARLEDWGLKI